MARPTVRLAEMASLIRRGLSPKYADESDEETILVINQRCIRDGRVDTAKARLAHPPANGIGDRELAPGDILVNSTGVGTVGRTAPWTGHPAGSVTACDSHVTIVRPGSECDPRYLAMALRASEDAIEGLARGSTGQVELSRDSLAGVLVPAFALREQEGIAGVLGSFDDLIETNRRLAAQMRGVAQVAARKALAGRTRTVPLTDVATVDKGFSYKSAELDGDEMVLLNLKNAGRGGHFRRDGYKPLSTARHKQGHIVHAGDVIVAMTDLTQDRDIIARPLRVQAPDAQVEIVASLDLAVLRPHVGATREFIWAALSDPAFRRHALGYCSGTTVLHMKGTALSEYLVPKPDEQLISYLTETVEPLLVGADEVDLEADSLAAQRDELLPLLMSGTVRVRDMEGAIS